MVVNRRQFLVAGSTGVMMALATANKTMAANKPPLLSVVMPDPDRSRTFEIRPDPEERLLSSVTRFHKKLPWTTPVLLGSTDWVDKQTGESITDQILIGLCGWGSYGFQDRVPDHRIQENCEWWILGGPAWHSNRHGHPTTKTKPDEIIGHNKALQNPGDASKVSVSDPIWQLFNEPAHIVLFYGTELAARGQG